MGHFAPPPPVFDPNKVKVFGTVLSLCNSDNTATSNLLLSTVCLFRPSKYNAFLVIYHLFMTIDY